VRPNDDLPTVAEILMSSGYRTVPVMEDSRLVGVVSRTDVVKVLPQVEGIKDVTVEGIMSPNTQTVLEEATIPQARKILLSLDERAIPVVDGKDRLVGVVGLKDFTEYLWKPKERATKGEQLGEKIPFKLEVKSIMRRPPITVGERATVAEAAALMDRHHISIVIVAREGRILGVVSQADLMELVASFKGRDQLYVQISGLDEDETWSYEGLYDIIQRGIRRISDIVTPSILNVHVAKHEETPLKTIEARSKYSLRARLTCDSGMYYAWEHDWDLFKVMDRVMEQFERRIKKEKEMRLQGRRGSQERRTPPRAS
jgi:CBS domain-containing protein